MIGERFWSTGITVQYGYAGATFTATGHVQRYGWRATCRFLDDGFSNDNLAAGHISTEGDLGTRYYVGDLTGDETSMNAIEAMVRSLTAAIDVVKRDAEALGIQFGVRDIAPTVYGHRDGEDPECPLPYGWRALVNAQAERLGWRPAYSLAAEASERLENITDAKDGVVDGEEG